MCKFYHNISQITTGAAGTAAVSASFAHPVFRYDIVAWASVSTNVASLSVSIPDQFSNTQAFLGFVGVDQGGAGAANKMEMFGPGITAVSVKTPAKVFGMVNFWY
jgi:hypothetical protein